MPVLYQKAASRLNGVLDSKLIHVSMKHLIVMKSDPIYGEDKIEEFQQSLELIDHKLDTEILGKQKTIERQEQEIWRLHLLAEGKDKIILEIREKLSEYINNSEGNRQIINKLLGDISRLRQDLEWYKKTYETRSLFGMMREKLLRKKS